MKRRIKMSRKSSKKNFRRGTKVKGKNMPRANPMRGGIRL